MTGDPPKIVKPFYNKWGLMASGPVVSTALRLLVTSALGGHETSGEVIFIEKTAGSLT